MGGRTSIPVDVRILRALRIRTWKPKSKRGSFREEDLYYRLKVIHIHMPSLREISDDVPVLANHFLAECCRDSGKQVELSPGVLRRMRAAEWPGNVRQLQNEIKRLVACAQSRVIGEEDLAGEVRERQLALRPSTRRALASLKTAVGSSKAAHDRRNAAGHRQQSAEDS